MNNKLGKIRHHNDYYHLKILILELSVQMVKR